MKNSREKGKRGEREWAALLRGHGIKARRGRQYSGGPESPDVVSDLPIHWEVKRSQTFNAYEATKQAEDESLTTTRYPAVAHRRNGKPWLVVMEAGYFLALLESVKQRGLIEGRHPPVEGGDGK